MRTGLRGGLRVVQLAEATRRRSPVSSTQSRPVMPRSNRPSATYVRDLLGAQDAHLVDAGVVDRRLVVDARSDRLTVRSAASNSSRVARSSEPLGRTSFSTAARVGGTAIAQPRTDPGRSQRRRSAGRCGPSRPRRPRPPRPRCGRPGPRTGPSAWSLVLGGEHAEDDRHAGVELRLLDARGALAGHDARSGWSRPGSRGRGRSPRRPGPTRPASGPPSGISNAPGTHDLDDVVGRRRRSAARPRAHARRAAARR